MKLSFKNTYSFFFSDISGNINSDFSRGVARTAANILDGELSILDVSGCLEYDLVSILILKTEIDAVAKKGSPTQDNVEAIREKFGQYSRCEFYVY